MNKRVTIKDVAKKTGLSISTISLVINNKGNVSEETKQKVLQAITIRIKIDRIRNPINWDFRININPMLFSRYMNKSILNAQRF